MEDADGGLSFDFEGGLEAAGPAGGSAPSGAPQTALINTNTQVAAALTVQKTQQARKNYRQTVCRHWLRGLCMKGDACGFLHQYDKARMPVCRFFAKFGECREPDCIYKHTNEDIKECNMYKLGFCPNGPDCRYRHQKLPGPPPLVEQNVQKLQHRIYAPNTNSNPTNNGKYLPLQSLEGPPGGGRVSEEAQPPRVVRPAQQQPPQLPPPHGMVNGPVAQAAFPSIALPLPPGFCRYFIVKSSNRENLELSVERGLWATHRNNEAKLNEAFDTCDHVILIFSVNETRHFQGCARMMSKIGGIVGGGGWKYAHGTAHYGRNFRLKWLKLCELTFNKSRHLRNSYNENLPVKISRDCQELEPSVGDQLALLLYREPDSELLALAKKAEEKREEERARGGQEAEHETDIIPFEDNDEEDLEEDDSDEEDTASQSALPNLGPGGRGRPPVMGRGGRMWPPHGPGFEGMGRGGRGMMGGPGGRGPPFHPEMGGEGFGMGFDRFGMGPGEGFMGPGGEGFMGPGGEGFMGPGGEGFMGPADSFMGPGDPFGGPAGPGRGFPPFGHPGGPGPGFAGPDFPSFGPMDGPGPMGFPGRPPPPNGMMMGPNGPGPGMMGPPQAMMGGGPMMGTGARPPHFMGGPAPGPMGGRGPGRPMGMPFRPPFAGRGGRGGPGEQQKRRRGDRGAASKLGNGGSKGRSNQTVSASEQADGGQRQQLTAFGITTSFLDGDESESEDEAPRRSRHGQAKKRRRGFEGDNNEQRWDQAGTEQWEVPSGDADEANF